MISKLIQPKVYGNDTIPFYGVVWKSHDGAHRGRTSWSEMRKAVKMCCTCPAWYCDHWLDISQTLLEVTL